MDAKSEQHAADVSKFPGEACTELGADMPEEEFDHGMEMLGWLLVLLITCGALWVVLG